MEIFKMKKIFCIIAFCSVFNLYAGDSMDSLNDDSVLERITISKCSTFAIQKLDSKMKSFCLKILEKGTLKNKPYSNYILGESLKSGINISKDVEKSVFFINKAKIYNLKKNNKLTSIEMEYILKARNFK
jgi:hypothetical protein